jgi:hypothetical protein
MGIRFRCPNGHKLNVKSFLAGKRGVCPDCGQTFRIPPEGTDDSGVIAMPLESRRNESTGVNEDNLAESDFETSVAVAAAAVSEPTQAVAAGVLFLPPMPAPQGSAAGGPVALVRGPGMPVTAVPAPNGPAPAAAEIYFPEPVGAPTPPKPAPAPPAPPTAADPIAEAPNAVWYVRPPSGGQYGPARGDVLRKWIGEGRVSSDSLVWREGWTDWREAALLFPGLVASAGAPAPVPGPLPGAATVPVIGPKSTATRPADRKPISKRGSNEIAVAALVCLVLVCLILVVVLVIVLSQGST